MDDVERPLAEQLVVTGWRHVVGDLDQPAKTNRPTFAEAIQGAVLRRQLRALDTCDVEGFGERHHAAAT